MASNLARTTSPRRSADAPAAPQPATESAGGRGGEQELLNLVGASRPFVGVLDLIRKMARCDATVLIQGETGTGKELAARGIHYLGPRRDQPFVPVNCGAIPDTLVESEFFGHVRGAFTDARDARCGLIASAEAGTLFLDEVETLSPRGQVALLRFLQDRVYRPVGGRQPVRGDVRVIAASNAPIAALVASGLFRSDLMYRLAIMGMRMPALRERRGDAVLLARHFIRGFARQYGVAEKQLDEASLEALERHDWPGNVRELENLVHREFLLADDETIALAAGLAPGQAQATDGSCSQASLSALLAPASRYYELDYRRARAAMLAEFEKTYVCNALAQAGGNVSQAARRAGKERRAFGKLIKKHAIDRSRYRG
jgi:two-component system, NtrC family, response regulator GlrR